MPDSATPDDRAYVTTLESLTASRTEQLRSAIHDLERSYDITMGTLGNALGLKDYATLTHSRRVTACTIAIARATGVPKDQIDVIARGAFLHDIGMLGVPDHILKKPRELEPEEIATTRQHCFLGHKLLQTIPFLKEAAEIVYAHHERYDGTGYPRGLKGAQIPLGARICAVAETLDAIMSDRPYRKAQSLEAARAEIVAWSGKQFDPEVVKVFLAIPEHIWQELRREIEVREGLTH